MKQARRFPNADSHHIWLPPTLYGATREELTRNLGFHFTGRVEGRGQHEVYMPLGWGMVAAGEGVYHLLDDQDRKRAIISKEVDLTLQASYHVLWLRRYGVTVEECWREDVLAGFRWKVVSGDLQLLREGDWVEVSDGEGMDEYIDCLQAATNWLFENKPRWEDPFAYWEE